MRIMGHLAITLAAMSLASAAHAQAPVETWRPPSSWFGVPSPGPVTAPDQRTFEARDNAYGPAPVHFKGPRDPSGALKGDKLMKDVNTIVDFSIARKNAGDPLWGRISGLPGARAAVEWSVERLKAAGLEARTEEYVVERPVYLPKTWSVTVKGDASYGAGTQDVVLRSAMPTPTAKTMTKEISAPLVFVGRGSAAELANVDVKGKIGVVNVVPNDSLFAAREKGVARELASRGAVGVINAVESPGNLLFYDSRYGCGEGPCFLVGGDDGAFLESVIGRAAKTGKSVKAQLNVSSEIKEGLRALNGVAVLPGKSDEIVIINGHADAWFDGANDNADGLSVLIGLAEYFAKKPKPARTLLFMVSGGHHTGNGPAAFIAANPEIMAKTVMVINLEHVAQIAVGQESRLDPGADNYASGVWSASTAETPKGVGAANTTPYMMELLGKAARDYGVVTSYQPSTSAPGDLGAYIRAGKPSVQLISSEVYYHSSGDTPSTISVPGLERAAVFFAGLIEDIAKAPRDKLVPAKTP